MSTNVRQGVGDADRGQDQTSGMALVRDPLLRRLPGAVALAFALAACGSTVQISSTATVSSGGLGTTGGAFTSGTSGTGGDVVSGTSGGGSSTSGSTGGTGGQVTTGATGQQLATTGTITRPTAPGVSSNEPIKIGVITQPGLEQAAKAFGLDGVTTGDTKAQVNAVVTWIRANGGLGGHPVQVYEYAVDVSDAAWQSNACASMTQDHKVRFVVTVLASLQGLAECLAKAGVGLLADNTNFGDRTMAQYAPILGNPSELGQGRMMTLLVDDLWKRGWLTSTSKIGLLVDDGPDGHATVDGPLTTVLRRHGLKPAVTRYINPKTGDGGSSQSGSAVVGFRAGNVDRIIPVMYSPLYFMIAAESQRYYPAYAMVSAQGPGALLEGTAPANQLKNAAGIGWAPYLDIGKGPKPPPVSTRETLCFQLMRKAGQAATSALIKGFQTQVCDMLFYLKDLADLKPAIPSDLLTSARIQLGKGFVSPATYRVDVTHRTAGVAGYRSLAYLDSCTCFQYVSPVVATS